jgi:hypothetical protein
MCLAFFMLKATAQTIPTPRQSVAILNMDSKGLPYTSVQLGNLARLELDKLDTFEVMDVYDIRYLAKKDSLDISECFGKICLVEVGGKIKVDKMLSGTLERFGEKLIVSMKLIDVKTQSVEKVKVIEYLYNPEELQTMMQLTLRLLLSKEIEEELFNRLTVKNNYESAQNNPYADILRLNGPRLGFTYFTGTAAKYLTAPETEGGFNAFPMMFQFGYQFEKQYLNEGNFQALVEVVPMVTGVDQGLFIPSLTILQGMRNNKNGFEFALGPSFSLITEARGYYENGVWKLRSEWTDSLNANPNPLEWRLDRRGEIRFHSGFIFAVGKTFKSGKLNIPVNAYVIPSKDGMRFGASFGFNAKREKMKETKRIVYVEESL